MGVKAISLLFLVGCLFSAPAVRAEPQRVVVLDLTPERGVDDSTVRVLNGILLNEIQRSKRFTEVIGQQDIAAMLRLEEERVKLQGCVDEGCLADIGGALGVEYLIAGALGRLGGQYVLNMKLMNAKSAKVEGRTSLVIEPEETKLLDAVKQAVKEVVLEALPPLTALAAASGQSTAEALSTPIPGPAPAPGGPTAATPSSSDGTSIAPWISLGLTVAVGAAGGTLAGLAYRDHTAMDDELSGSPTWRDLESATETKSLAADILFGVAGAAAVTTLILFLIGGDSAPQAEIAIVPQTGGGVAALRWGM